MLEFAFALAYSYFCTKLQKKVDTDFIAAIVAVLIGAFITWAEKSMGKRRNAKSAVGQRPQRGILSVEESIDKAPEAKKSEHVVSEKHLKQPVAEKPENFIADVKPVPPKGLSPLDRDKLRDAVIWGEILKRKF